MTEGPEVGDDYYNDPADGCQCPHCDGLGTVPCYCGGDLCVCDNYGEDACYVCGGEGEVTEARYALYMENQRKNAETMRKIFEQETPSK